MFDFLFDVFILPTKMICPVRGCLVRGLSYRWTNNLKFDGIRFDVSGLICDKIYIMFD